MTECASKPDDSVSYRNIIRSQELDESAHERSVVIQHDGELSGEQENEEIPTKGSEELKTTDGNGIEVEFRRRKMESLRRRYLLNALERLRKI